MTTNIKASALKNSLTLKEKLTGFKYKLAEEKYNWINIMIMTIISIPMILIYLGMIIVSFSTSMNGLIPKGFTFQNWSFLWSELVIDHHVFPSIWLIFGNTFKIALGTSIIEVGISLMAAYSISRGKFPGKNLLIQSTLLTHAFPAITSLIATFYILNVLGLLNTLTGIILIKGFAGVGMSTWMLKGFFDDVPRELDWAASVDGCGKIKIFFAAYLPSIWTGIIAVSLFAFLGGWGEYILVSVFIFDDKLLTLPLVLRALFEETSSSSYGITMALATFYMLPAIIFYILSQKSLGKMKV